MHSVLGGVSLAHVVTAGSLLPRTNESLKDHIFYTVNITFLEVKMEDYGRPFTCHAGVSSAYIILKLPGNAQSVMTEHRALGTVGRESLLKISHLVLVSRDVICSDGGSRGH